MGQAQAVRRRGVSLCVMLANFLSCLVQLRTMFCAEWRLKLVEPNPSILGMGRGALRCIGVP